MPSAVSAGVMSPEVQSRQIASVPVKEHAMPAGHPPDCHDSHAASHELQGECGPLPFKLPTDGSRPIQAATSNPCPVSPREVGNELTKAKDALVTLGCEARISVPDASRDGDQDGLSHAERECGPLPCKLPTDASMVWADDELRWHLVSLLTTKAHHESAQAVLDRCAMIDPLLMAGWVVLHVHTWDSSTNDHTSLEPIFTRLASAMGFVGHQTARLYRMFPMDEGPNSVLSNAEIQPFLVREKSRPDGFVTGGENLAKIGVVALSVIAAMPVGPFLQMLGLWSSDGTPSQDDGGTVAGPVEEFQTLVQGSNQSDTLTEGLPCTTSDAKGRVTAPIMWNRCDLEESPICQITPKTTDPCAGGRNLESGHLDATRLDDPNHNPCQLHSLPILADHQFDAVRSPGECGPLPFKLPTSGKNDVPKVGAITTLPVGPPPPEEVREACALSPAKAGPSESRIEVDVVSLPSPHNACQVDYVSSSCRQADGARLHPGECGPLPCLMPTQGLPCMKFDSHGRVMSLMSSKMGGRDEPHVIQTNAMTTGSCAGVRHLDRAHLDANSLAPINQCFCRGRGLPPLADHQLDAVCSSGECGPLPFKLPTSSKEAVPKMSGTANVSAGNLEPVECRAAGAVYPATVASSKSSAEVRSMSLHEHACLVSDVPLSCRHDDGARLHHGECGPLPYLMPTQRLPDVTGDAHGNMMSPISWNMCGLDESNAVQNTPATTGPFKGGRIFEHGHLDAQSHATTDQCSCQHKVPVEGNPNLEAQPMSVQERSQLLETQGHFWADDEIRWQLANLSTQLRDELKQSGSYPNWVILDPLLLDNWIQTEGKSCAAWANSHCPLPEVVIAVVFAHLASALRLSGFHHVKWPQNLEVDDCCGPLAIAFIARIMLGRPLPTTHAEVLAQHDTARAQFQEGIQHHAMWVRPLIWANGLATQAEQELIPVLIDHGVPHEHAGTRAKAAVRAIGAQPVLTALGSRIPWKQLKTLGNQSKFQFLLPAELQSKITEAAGKGDIGRPKGGKKSKKPPPEQPPVVLDPSKFAISQGVFQSNSQPLHQRPLKAVGPATEGVVIVTKAEAAPYLAQGKAVSNLPLALLVLQCTLAEVTTSLPHQAVTVPCHCVVNQEPMLIDMVMVQIGSGLVEKTQASRKIHIDAVDVGTLRITVFRDEIEGTWEHLTQGPMKYVVHHVPLLRMCREPGCQCPHWHNHEKVDTKDALLDVWRRQYLRNGYKPEPPSSATMFAVSIRVPSCLVLPLLKLSGTAGIYVEPRSLDSRTVHEDYAIVWLTRLQPAALNHLCQTNPTAIGLARVGDRIGLRTLAIHASDLSKAVRPDAVYLPAGPKQQFLAGPFPFGTDRGSLTKALQQIDWEARPLQPLASIDNKGAMWLIQATDDPPASLLSMGHGDVMISKHKGPRDAKETKARPVATPATIALCNTQTSQTTLPDLWAAADPWGWYAPSSMCQTDASEGLKQLESKIQKAVLASLPASSNQMEVDDVPDRVQALEQQMSTMMQKHAQLEATVTDHAARHTAQLGSVQHQLQTQGAELRGHIESQQQNLQALFESQMSQIRSLLKRPREDHE
ncbi:unnamed protein product [Cladocopium goreaui]|uniref:Uncharacterized protein n=1 Tax=Cladocopium goreaui TaxID=2562237 RepID=A0A9P1CL99_9DINO|nr:unnamed protein product [Cladocopium goreaui]